MISLGSQTPMWHSSVQYGFFVCLFWGFPVGGDDEAKQKPGMFIPSNSQHGR